MTRSCPPSSTRTVAAVPAACSWLPSSTPGDRRIASNSPVTCFCSSAGSAPIILPAPLKRTWSRNFIVISLLVGQFSYGDLARGGVGAAGRGGLATGVGGAQRDDGGREEEDRAGQPPELDGSVQF